MPLIPLGYDPLGWWVMENKAEVHLGIVDIVRHYKAFSQD